MLIYLCQQCHRLGRKSQSGANAICSSCGAPVEYVEASEKDIRGLLRSDMKSALLIFAEPLFWVAVFVVGAIGMYFGGK